ncbi:MAG TPA: hypothetical protein VLS96_19720 [Nodosilinea sp.]|nr:hypothetical protein [Nodosilinea sp.]
MLLYLQIPHPAEDADGAKDQTPSPGSPGSEAMPELEQMGLKRHHQAETTKLYQRAREAHLCERRWML